MSLRKLYNRLPRFAQVLVEDTQGLHEYGRFMRVTLSVGTVWFLYQFSKTMAYMESEKRPETEDERKLRRAKEKEYREQVRKEALVAGSVKSPSNEHIEKIIQRANS